MPDFDLSALEGEPPKWLKWILDHKDEILAILAGIAAGLLALKLGLSPLQALGVALLTGGLVYAFEKLVEYINDPSWESFGGVIQGIGVAVIGLGVAFSSLLTVVVGVFTVIWGTIIKYWDSIQEHLQDGIDWLADQSDWIHSKIGDVLGATYDEIVRTLQLSLNWADSFIKSLRGMFDGFIQFFKGVFTGNWSQAWDGLKQIALNIFNIIANTVSTKFNFILSKVQTVIEQIKALFNNAVQKIISWFDFMGIQIPTSIAEKFKSIINKVLSAIESILNKPIGAINSLISKVNELPGVSISKLSKISIGRLKTGGIINMPNKGTLLGGASAIGGEAGREGVIPLTDQQAMAQLGREIGRNVLVNLTNITSMNGRVLAREMKQVTNEQDFAFNM